MKNNNNSMETFSNQSVPSAVLQNVVPAIAAMMLVLIYNLADTFFIGKTDNALMVAAVSLCTPVFLIFTAVGTIFGVGGTSTISRAFGSGDTDKARQASACCLWGSLFSGAALAVLLFLFMDPLLMKIGASRTTFAYAKEYLSIVSLTGPFTTFSNCCANIIRTEGRPGTAMLGQLIGNVLNIVLDPILILGFGWNIAGAAAATALSNAVSAAVYIFYFHFSHSRLNTRLRDFRFRSRAAADVLSIGIPAALGDLLMSFSQIIVNGQMEKYGDMAVAGIGVAMKVTMITGMLCIGFGQGVQPLLGYCTGAGDKARFHKILRFSTVTSLIISTGLTAVCWIFTRQIAGAFLTQKQALNYAVEFARILLTTSFLFGVFYVLCNALQAMGASVSAFITNISRQGLIYIPALFILQHFLGIRGLVWAQPTADILSVILVAVLCRRSVRAIIDHPDNRISVRPSC